MADLGRELKELSSSTTATYGQRLAQALGIGVDTIEVLWPWTRDTMQAVFYHPPYTFVVWDGGMSVQVGDRFVRFETLAELGGILIAAEGDPRTRAWLLGEVERDEIGWLIRRQLEDAPDRDATKRRR